MAKMRFLLVCCVLPLFVIVRSKRWDYVDLYQVAVKDDSGYERERFERHRYRRKRMGEPCLNSDECRRNLCCSKHGGIRTCKRRAKLCEDCTEDQVKGGYYMEHCPCRWRKAECVVPRGERFGICLRERR
ncbi:hypothetical protein V5799_015646 [Amblyomma americanum]|uniref:Secreted protein n=1 Tax=Amblyomma americanum TaxID=6943 RepID=A0AAQ4F8N7_AMBAM